MASKKKNKDQDAMLRDLGAQVARIAAELKERVDRGDAPASGIPEVSIGVKCPVIPRPGYCKPPLPRSIRVRITLARRTVPKKPTRRTKGG